MEVKKILWPTDLSHNSNTALAYVNAVSQKFQAQVHLAYVAEDLSRFDHLYGDADPEHLKALQAKEMARAKQKMEKVCQSELDGCPAYFHHLAAGDPASEILKLADKEGVDLIIMATQGRGQTEMHRRFFGSVTEKVVKNSNLPVMVVPGR
ncbi:MAG: universal stress protein [Desulfarculaceae bacterium]|jgi:nucleotide-binding universal stress UspA family protein